MLGLFHLLVKQHKHSHPVSPHNTCITFSHHHGACMPYTKGSEEIIFLDNQSGFFTVFPTSHTVHYMYVDSDLVCK